MRAVLSVASEVAPLVKTGGLADVAGALPAAVAAEDWAMRTLLPGYPAVLEAARDGQEVWREERLFGGPGRGLGFPAAGVGPSARSTRRISTCATADRTSGAMAATGPTTPNASRR